MRTDEQIWADIQARPIAGGKGDVKAPPRMTKEEKELIRAQTDIAKESLAISRENQNISESFIATILAQQGYSFDPTSGSITEIPEANASQIRKLTEERLLAAMKGELPVDPTVERNIAEGRSTFESQLQKQGISPGSSSYNQGIAEFEKRANELRYSVSHGEMTSAEAMRQGQSLIPTAAAGTSLANQPLSNLATSSSLFSAPLASLTDERWNQYSGDLASKEAEDRNRAGWYQFGGQAAGTAAALAMLSDSVLKENINESRVDALSIIDSIRVCEFDWKSTGAHCPVGLIANDIEKLLPEAVGKNEEEIRFIDPYILISLLIKAIQELKRGG